MCDSSCGSPRVVFSGKRRWPVIMLLLIVASPVYASDLIISRHESIGSTAYSISLLALGVLIGLFAYTLFLAISTRERFFTYFLIIMLLLTVLQTFAAFDRFFVSLTYNRVTVITHLLFITFFLFFEDFFTLSVHAPNLSRTNRLSIYVIVLYTMGFLLAKALFPQAGTLHAMLDFIRELFVFYTNILFLWTIVRAIAWQRMEGTLMLIAFIPPALLTSINAMHIFPFMAAYRNFVGFLMTYNQPIGLSVQAILFSLAVGNRYNRVKGERVQSERESERLRQLDEEKTQFFMNMSHELRTPLTIMLGMTGQLRQGSFGDSIRHNDRIFETIERNGARLLRQVNHLLRIGRGKENPPVDPLPVAETLHRICEEFEPIATGRGIRCTHACSEELNPVQLQVDGEDFEIAVMNLISNALKFTTAGGSIGLGARLDERGNLLVEVRDTGKGIDPALHETIFTRYFQEPGKSDLAQTGLGLPLVKRVMESCNGTVSLKSVVGEGSTFTLIFPSELLIEGDSAQENGPSLRSSFLYKAEFPSSQEIAEEPADELAGERPTILVVDDNRDMCTFIRSILREQYRVLVATSADDGLDILEAHPVELIISDIMMPGNDGHAFLKTIMERQQCIPLIFLTARDSTKEKIESLKEGAMHYLTKPFSAQMLLATVDATLSHDRQLIGSNIAHLRRGFDLLFDELEHPQRIQGKTQRTTTLKFAQEHGLSARESQILALLLGGKSDKEIASELDLSVKTVANHNRRLYRKVQVGSRFELISKVLGKFA